jgi:hypothetical protein
MTSQGLVDAKSSQSGNWLVDEVLINQLPGVGWELMRSIDCRVVEPRESYYLTFL